MHCIASVSEQNLRIKQVSMDTLAAIDSKSIAIVILDGKA